MKKILLILLLLVFACTKNVEPEPTPVVPDPTCDDGILNQGESDVDCGGPCKVCTDGYKCTKNLDCVSNNCVNNVCIGSSCSDGIKNQGEIKVDCGGPCDPCETCTDGIQNQDEEDVDCGGVCAECVVEVELTAEQLTDLKDKLKLNMKATFLTNSYPSGLDVGDTHLFALGINNVMSDVKEFTIEYEFRNARDTNNNPIVVDKEYILGWLDENDFESYSLERYEQVYLPLIINIGDKVSEDDQTIPGTYYFLLTVYNDLGLGRTEYDELEFSVRVK